VAAHTVRLVACLGTKSSPHLVSHFLRHYHDLGVAEFLIVLHADRGDRQAMEVKARLREWRIEPIREIEEYSAKLKHEHCTAVVRERCEPQGDLRRPG